MIRSMTGFGDAAAERGGYHFAVELRSLNNRYFKAQIRLPEQIAGLEAELESHLRQRVGRGSFVLTVKMRVGDAGAVSRVNQDAVLDYLKHLETLQEKAKGHAVHIELTALLALPGVLQPAEEAESLVDRSRPIVLDLVTQALERMNQMRVREGAALRDDLLHQKGVILEHVAQVRERAPVVLDEYHDRLRNRIDQLMAKAELEVHQPDLIREVAIFADRSDISEELTRLTGHLEQFQQVIDSDQGEPCGRTLDFIAQELLREANTIASKSNDATISRATVVMKSAIDRIKEQVQNVE